MKSLSTGLGKSLVLFTMIMLIGATSAFAGKKVLIEQQTGAWCGWCPGGTVVMDELIHQYPDKVIGVKWHNGDSMALPEQGQFAQTFGINSYPSGTINRQVYNGGFAIGWQQWTTAITPKLNEENIADLVVTYDYNASTEMITGTVTAKIVKDDNRQLALNLYIMEDYCSGIGSMWDQHNYFPQYSEYSNHPYYKLPGVIKGYQHMKVVRKVLGGLYGDITKMPATVTAGQEFSQTFTFKKDAKWKAEDLYVVGIIQAQVVNGNTLEDGSIINAQESTKLPEIFSNVSVTQPNLLVTPGNSITKKVKVENPQDFPITVKLMADGTLPAGWNITFPASVLIPAKGSTDVDATITAPAGNATFAQISFKGMADKVDGYKSVTSRGTLNVLTDNTEYLNIGLNPNISQVNNIMLSTEKFKNTTVLVPYSEDILKAYPATMFKYIGISSAYSTFGIMGIGTPEAQTLRDYIKAAVAGGVKIFMSNELEMYVTFTDQAGVQDAKSLFSSFGLGVEGNPIKLVTTNSQGQLTGYLKINAKGISGEPITDGMAFEINGQAGQAGKTVYYAENLKLNTNIATPILNYTDGSGTVVGVAGARITLPTTRIVYLGYCFEATTEASKQQLATNILTWLFNSTAEGPKISVSSNSVSFGTVKTTATKEMEITVTNPGDEDLTINSIVKQGDADDVFTIVEGSSITSIPKGQNAKIVVKFSPKGSQAYFGGIVISTNAKNESSTSIALSGTGDASVGVAYGTTPNGALSMTMTPNPVVENSQFNYTVNGDNANVRIYVMDLSGKFVSELVNSNLSAGTYNLNFSASKYVSGTYFIMAEIDGSKAQIPVIITK